MKLKRKTSCFTVGFVCLLATTTSSGAISGQSGDEKQEYTRELARIKALEKSWKSGSVNHLKEYETLADEVQKRWSQKSREYNARLMLELCRTLSSVDFKDDRRHDVARKYALSVLDRPEGVSLETELKLTGHVMTAMGIPTAPKGDEFARRREKDVEIRLHAWERLTDAIDPKWDPNDVPLLNVVPPAASGLPSGIAPEDVKDPKLRAEYEAAIEKNRQKAQEYNEQYRLRSWLKEFPPRAEQYIIQAYSKSPYNIEELTGLLNQYMRDEQTRSRIFDGVRRNTEIAARSDGQSKQ